MYKETLIVIICGLFDDSTLFYLKKIELGISISAEVNQSPLINFLLCPNEIVYWLRRRFHAAFHIDVSSNNKTIWETAKLLCFHFIKRNCLVSTGASQNTPPAPRLYKENTWRYFPVAEKPGWLLSRFQIKVTNGYLEKCSLCSHT